MPTRTNLLASGDTELASPTFAVDAGSPATIHVNAATGNPSVELERYDGTSYFPLGKIFKPGIIVSGQGTYRVKRIPQGIAVQVDVEK